MFASPSHSRSPQVVSQIGVAEVSKALELSCGLRSSAVLEEVRALSQADYLLCMHRPDIKNYLYVHVPLFREPGKSFTCLYPEGNVSHGLLLGALLRAIGREGVVEAEKSAEGMVRDPLGDFHVHGMSALFNVEANTRVTELLAGVTASPGLRKMGSATQAV